MGDGGGVTTNSSDYVASVAAGDLNETNEYRLYANLNVSNLRTTGMRYTHGDQFTRSYDFCYYEVVLSPQIDIEEVREGVRDGSNITIEFVLREMENLSVYIYEGPDKNSANKSLVDRNVMPQIN